MTIRDSSRPRIVWDHMKHKLGFFFDSNVKKPEKSVYSVFQNKEEPHKLAFMVGSIFIRLAGLYGALAVVMGAYGNHVFFPRHDVPDHLKDVYKSANYYHILHSIVLLAIPLTRYPNLVGTVITLGMTIYSGTCYFHALTGNPVLIRFTPVGGTTLIIGWLMMIF